MATDQFRDLKSPADFQSVFEALPGNLALINTDDIFTILAVTKEYVKISGISREQLTGKGIFESFPSNPDNPDDNGSQNLRASFQKVLEEKIAHQLPDQRYDIYDKNGLFTEKYWRALNTPVLTETGEVSCIIHSAEDITHLILTENDSRFRQIANTLPLVVWTASPDGNLTYISDQWESYYGNPIKESLGTGWANYVHPEDALKAGEQWSLSLSNGLPYETEFRVQFKSADYHWVLVRALPIKNEKGEITEWVGSNTDIEDKKISEHALRKSEQRIRSFVDSAPFPIGVYTGEEMRIELANKTIVDVWGKGNDVIGKLFKEILPELDNQKIFDQLRDVYTTGTPYHAKNQRIELLIDGKWIVQYFNYSFMPLFNEEGEIYGVMNTAADVTDLNIAKQKLEENEKSFRNTILKAPVAMCILTGPDHVVELANDRMIELWGKTGAEVRNKPIFEGIPEGRDQGFEELLGGVYNTGETAAAQAVPVKLLRNGVLETLYVNFVYEAKRESNEIISGILAVAVDVTAQVLARQKIEEVVASRTAELAAANASLQKSNEELAQFAYVASHDLQEPIRKISIFSQLLEDSLGNVNERSQNYLTKIHKSSGRMIALINDVLAYSELSGEDNIYSTVDLNEIVAAIANDFELLIEQKSASLVYKNLPVLEAIPRQMSQLFSNLISNALKFSKADVLPVINISVKPLLHNDIFRNTALNSGITYYNIELRDNGIGFEEAHTQRIFNIFQRLHDKASYTGTGIGLALCKKIVRNHHGEITASADAEGGAIFNIFLPKKQTV